MKINNDEKQNVNKKIIDKLDSYSIDIKELSVFTIGLAEEYSPQEMYEQVKAYIRKVATRNK